MTTLIYRGFNNHRHAIVACSEPHALFAEVISKDEIPLLEWGATYGI